MKGLACFRTAAPVSASTPNLRALFGSPAHFTIASSSHTSSSYNAFNTATSFLKSFGALSVTYSLTAFRIATCIAASPLHASIRYAFLSEICGAKGSSSSKSASTKKCIPSSAFSTPNDSLRRYATVSAGLFFLPRTKPRSLPMRSSSSSSEEDSSSASAFFFAASSSLAFFSRSSATVTIAAEASVSCSAARAAIAAAEVSVAHTVSSSSSSSSDSGSGSDALSRPPEPFSEGDFSSSSFLLFLLFFSFFTFPLFTPRRPPARRRFRSRSSSLRNARVSRSASSAAAASFPSRSFSRFLNSS
mmetsp:Transcript_4877/g.20727  ORF Transcript_4877/g.20727 Transcript_4877/m.20727 type:complete len:303 (-) Transcript_4877:151-1059(-)